MKVVLPMPKYAKPEARWAFYDEMLRRTKEVPGIESAGMITFLPLSFNGMNFSFTVEGQAPTDDMKLPFALCRVVSPDYFRAMGIPLQRGRFFDAHDRADSQPVALVNRRFAEQYWPGEDPTGKRLKIGPLDSPNQWLTIVGVVGDVRQAGLYGDVRRDLYLPYAQDRRGFIAPRDLVVRTKGGDVASVAGAVRQAIWSVDKDQPIVRVATMDQRLASSAAERRFALILFEAFGFVAIVLVAIGLYGVLSASVTERTREIGVRLALGAQKRDVLLLILRQGLTLTLVGVSFGLLASWAVTRLLSNLLYGTSATDPLVFAGVASLLIVVALLACYVPARRAMKVDPLVILRYE